MKIAKKVKLLNDTLELLEEVVKQERFGSTSSAIDLFLNLNEYTFIQYGI